MSHVNTASDDLTSVVTLSTVIAATAGATDTVFVDGIIEGGAIRLRVDGVAPTTTEGQRVAAGGRLDFNSSQHKFSNVKIIRDGTDTPKIKWTFQTHQ